MLVMQEGDSLFGGLPVIHITYQQYIANPSAYHDPDVIVHISGYPTAGNLPADYVGYDSNLNMEDIGNIATKAIAKVEPSDTALYLHKVGDGFINKDGNYCITDVQISVGGTITLGTNCHVVDGGMSSNLVVETGTTNISGITYTKMGRLVTIHVMNVTAVDAVTIITGLPKPYGSAYITSNICNTPIGVNGEVIGRIEYSIYGSTNNWHYYCHAAAGYTSLSYISS